LSALIKIFFYTMFVISLFFLQSPVFYIIPVSLMILLLFTIPFRRVTQGWLPISLLLLFTFLGNVFFHHGKVLYHAGGFIITEEGITIAATRTLRLLLMISGAKIVMATTSIESLVAALGKIFRPVERLGLPVKEFFSTMGLVMQSLPKLKKEIAVIYNKKIKEDKVSGFLNRTKIASQVFSDLFVKGLESPEKFLDDSSKRVQDG
jgi:energy-coupling factor transporter transmembrane protein EcfT